MGSTLIRHILAQGIVNETYNIGGWNEQPNIAVAQLICSILDQLQPRDDGTFYNKLITFVTDRPGHDKRYSVDASKLNNELGWKPSETFETGLYKTIQWYLHHQDWMANVATGAYRDWITKQSANYIWRVKKEYA